MSTNFETISTGLNLGTKFLTKECAYFLGMLLADEKEVINGRVYWLAPVRHNPQHSTVEGVEEHFNYVRQIARCLNKENLTQMKDFFSRQSVRLQKFNAGKRGFVTLFEQISESYDIDDFVNDIQGGILKSNDEIIRAFLVGVFDGRSSFDKTYDLIALDYSSESIRNLIEKVLDKLGIDYKANTLATARVRKDPNAAPRNKQIRIKRPNDFIARIGLISATRFSKCLTKLSPEMYNVNDESPVLPGLKTITYFG